MWQDSMLREKDRKLQASHEIAPTVGGGPWEHRGRALTPFKRLMGILSKVTH